MTVLNSYPAYKPSSGVGVARRRAKNWEVQRLRRRLARSNVDNERIGSFRQPIETTMSTECRHPDNGFMARLP